MKKKKEKKKNIKTNCIYCKASKTKKINNTHTCNDCNNDILLLQKTYHLTRSESEKRCAKVWRRIKKTPKVKEKKPKEFNYKQYLKSKHWIGVKESFYSSKFFKGYCVCCGSTENFNIHHKTYINISNEPNTDLVCICGKCHIIVHKIIKYITVNDIKGSGYTLLNCHIKLRNKIKEFGSLDKASESIFKDLTLLV